MASVRINVSLPKETFSELAKAVGPRRRSRFISKAIKNALREEKAQRLAAEYDEAAEEIRQMNQDLDGVIGDGLDQAR
jgi:metal-responsive CopG/Arc/MetJ family transcriptional regulator